jgi:hypothetical protein
MQPILLALMAFVTTLLRSRLALPLEIVALRHQVAIYQRSVSRPRLHATDRLFWVWLSRLWSGWQHALVLVKLRTVIVWQKRRFRDHWRRLSQRGKPGQPAVSKSGEAHLHRGPLAARGAPLRLSGEQRLPNHARVTTRGKAQSARRTSSRMSRYTPRSCRYPTRAVGVVLVMSLLTSGCMFQTVRDQQAKAAALCTISGTVRTEHPSQHPLVVGLVRHMGSDVTAVENFRLFDHFVVEGGGLWFFRVSPGTYGLVAFADRKADLIYQPGEPFLRVDPHRLLVCVSSEEKRDIALVIPEDGRPSIAGDIAITELQARTVHDQLTASVGLLSAIGVITTLDDPRFRLENAASGMWAPFDFVFNFRPGVYFLQAYDHNKIPVLFVHGINGTPTSFRFLIERLDSHTFQPWVYYYPSGASLSLCADYLSQRSGLEGSQESNSTTCGLHVRRLRAERSSSKANASFAGPPVFQTRKATGIRLCPSVQTNSTTDTPKTTVRCLLDQTQAASPSRRAYGFSTTVSSIIRYPLATVKRAPRARGRSVCPDQSPWSMRVKRS